ncbi:hypothetical protein V8D89_002830, partial [Ganoderma adspersum]
ALLSPCLFSPAPPLRCLSLSLRNSFESGGFSRLLTAFFSRILLDIFLLYRRLGFLLCDLHDEALCRQYRHHLVKAGCSSFGPPFPPSEDSIRCYVPARIGSIGSHRPIPQARPCVVGEPRLPRCCALGRSLCVTSTKSDITSPHGPSRVSHRRWSRPSSPSSPPALKRLAVRTRPLDSPPDWFPRVSVPATPIPLQPPTPLGYVD